MADRRPPGILGGRHQRQRRAKFVADVAEERRLGAVEFGESFGPPAFLLVCASVCHRGSHVPCGQIKKASIVAVQYASGADADYEKPGHLVGAGCFQRQYQGCIGRLGPGPAGKRTEAQLHVVNGHGLTRPGGSRQRPAIQLLIRLR